MRFNPRWLIVAAALVAFGCANQKGPAEQAIAKIETAVAEIKDAAAKFAPSDLQGVEYSLAALKEKIAKGDYKAVLAEAPALTSAVDSLKQTVATKKSEAEAAIAAATAEWSSLSADVPKMVDAIQSRVDILGQARKLPKNISQEAFDAAKSGLESMKATWAEATAAFASGDAVDAVSKANSVKQMGTDVLQKLGMTPA
jgi:paraquat-inducible protein B